MGTGIDPLTGLPMVGMADLGYLDQIPFDAQVMPWKDYNATGRPGRGPAYPDDILPTNAVVNGQDQTNPLTPQTVYTDGNHNLRVALVGAGAGLGPYKISESDGDGGFGVPSNSTQTGASIGFRGPNPIRAFSFSVIPNPGGGAPGLNSFCEWQVGLTDGALTIILGGGLFYTSAWTTTPTPIVTVDVLDCFIDWQAFGMRPNHASFYCSSTKGDIQTSNSYIMGA